MNWSSTIEISRDSKIPIAEQISNNVLRLIMNGSLLPGAKLPPERDLAAILGVSRGTVKRAYARLVKQEAVDIRQGSGSYVLKNGHILERNQKKEATELIRDAFERLKGMGLTEKEVINLFNLYCLSTGVKNIHKKANIMVASNNYEILSDIEQQLSYLTYNTACWFTLTYLTLDVITSSNDPIQILLPYDLIIASSIDYPELIKRVPAIKSKIIEATLSPRTKSLSQLATVPQNSRISIVYRTDRFLRMVMKSLSLMGFSKRNVFIYKEDEYNPVSHSENGVSLVINFNESPVLLNKEFKQRNDEFINNGGIIMKFEYQLERTALVYIEDQIQRLVELS